MRRVRRRNRSRLDLDRSGRCVEAKASFLVGCDGAHSAVRPLMGSTFVGGLYQAAFMLADVDIEGRLPCDQMQLCPHESGPWRFSRSIRHDGGSWRPSWRRKETFHPWNWCKTCSTPRLGRDRGPGFALEGKRWFGTGVDCSPALGVRFWLVCDPADAVSARKALNHLPEPFKDLVKLRVAPGLVFPIRLRRCSNSSCAPSAGRLRYPALSGPRSSTRLATVARSVVECQSCCSALPLSTSAAARNLSR